MSSLNQYAPVPAINVSHRHRRHVAEQLFAMSSWYQPQKEHIQQHLPAGGVLRYQGKEVLPREVLPAKYRPFIVCDIDETITDYFSDFMQAIGDALQKPRTMDDLLEYGETSHIPGWGDPESLEVQLDIMNGTHPDHFPFANIPYMYAPEVMCAIATAGFQLCYVTARPIEVFQHTLRMLQLNGFPVHVDSEPDASIFHQQARNLALYSRPSSLSSKEYKSELIRRFTQHMRAQDGWEGQTIVIDDSVVSYQEMLDNQEIQLFAKKGVFNQKYPMKQGEQRFDTWQEVDHMLRKFYEESLQKAQETKRQFVTEEFPGTVFLVDTQEVGFSDFDWSKVTSLRVVSE